MADHRDRAKTAAVNPLGKRLKAMTLFQSSGTTKKSDNSDSPPSISPPTQRFIIGKNQPPRSLSPPVSPQPSHTPTTISTPTTKISTATATATATTPTTNTKIQSQM
eukprot:TRINITY_DN14109_c0_g1_i1.p1 TRINITY_DN14109_c0_g1~~TRINITY_DN14109_c0_g1_i1.p1  ORF type:complete len:107 (+),score=41.77 TRINITY_DN14109_c0_g1_i1:122-442(+)